MIEKIAAYEALCESANRMIKDRYIPGFDGMSAEGALLWLKINKDKISNLILNGKYEPMPVSSFVIAKRSGKARHLSKVTAIDTVIERTIINIMGAKADKTFSEYSFAYRPGRSVTSALEKFCEKSSTFRYAAKIDIDNCFDNINHDILQGQVQNVTRDKRLTALIMSFVKAPIIEDGEISENVIGIHQGAPLSPLLCNIYMDLLDKHLESEDISFLRYADDLVIFGNSVKELEDKVKNTSDFLLDKLKLNINQQKTCIALCNDIKFLGHSFVRDKSGILRISNGKSNDTIYRFWNSNYIRKQPSSIEVLSSGILRQKDFSAVFEGDSNNVQLALGALDVVNVFSNVIIDSNFTKAAFYNGVSINIFEPKTGEFLGSFTPSSPLKSEKLIFEQLTEYHNEGKRLALAKEFVLAANHNIKLNIRYYNKQDTKHIYEKALCDLDYLDSQIKKCDNHSRLLLLEAQSKQHYYSCIDSFISNSDFLFEHRSKRPPKNEINAMISFGNTLLYNLIATEINKTSLDIRIGFLHSTNKRKNSLNLDIADILKPLTVDRTVFALINRRAVRQCNFEYEENGTVYLNESGKRILISALTEKMNTSLKIREQSYDYYDIIKQETDKLICHFRNGDKYKAFRQVR